jgi:hypothetical protein
MVERRRATICRAAGEAKIIPFCGAIRYLQPPAGMAGRNPGRVLRPIDVILLLPVIAPVTVAILLGLLGWFVAWLVVVGTLVAVNLFADAARALRNCDCNPPRCARSERLSGRAVGTDG